MELTSHGMDETNDPGSRTSTRESVTDMSAYFIRKSLSEKSKRNTGRAVLGIAQAIIRIYNQKEAARKFSLHAC